MNINHINYNLLVSSVFNGINQSLWAVTRKLGGEDPLTRILGML